MIEVKELAKFVNLTAFNMGFLSLLYLIIPYKAEEIDQKATKAVKYVKYSCIVVLVPL